MHRKPGVPFELLIWSNDIKNEGSLALKKIFDKVKTKYFVVVEEDEIWFQDNWLSELIEAFERHPWGVLATNTLHDSVSGVSFPYQNVHRLIDKKFTYWANIKAGGGAMIFRTDELRKIEFQQKNLNDVLYSLTGAYDQAGKIQGRVENIYVYHAYSPYWNSLYPEVFKEKQKGQTIEQAKSLFDCDYNNKKPMRAFLSGNFNKYAQKVCDDNRREGFYWFAAKNGLSQKVQS